MTPESAVPPTSAEIYDQFRGLVAAGLVGAGERLPTVRQVALDLGVSPGTAARAFKMLEADHLVVTRVGAGTTVAPGAARTSGATMTQARGLVEAAKSNGDSLEDVLSVVRSLWTH